MRDNLENLIIVFAFAAAVATLAWFGYRAVSGGSGGDAPDPVADVRPGSATSPDEAPRGTLAEDEPETDVEEASSGEMPGAALPLARLRDRIADSTVIVESSESGRALGAGFVVAPGLVATSAGVAERAGGARARLVDGRSSTPIASVARVDPPRSLALLEVPGLDAPPLGADAEARVGLGDRIYALAGSDVGAGVSEGLVGSLRRVEGARAFTISVPIAAAVEGGPVVVEDGSVAGVAVRRFGDDGIEELVVGIGAVRDLAEGERERVPESEPRASTPRASASSTAMPTERPRPPARPPVEEEPPSPRPTRVPAAPTVRPELPLGAYERGFGPRDYLVTSATKLHERPDASSHVIARLRPDTVVTAVGEIEGWLRIRSTTGRRDGYLRRDDTQPLRRR